MNGASRSRRDEGMDSPSKTMCDFSFSRIFNGSSAADNGGASMRHGSSNGSEPP